MINHLYTKRILKGIHASEMWWIRLVLIFLNLEMETADPIIVQLNNISFLATDGYGRVEHRVGSTSIGAVNYAEGDCCHWKQVKRGPFPFNLNYSEESVNPGTVRSAEALKSSGFPSTRGAAKTGTDGAVFATPPTPTSA